MVAISRKNLVLMAAVAGMAFVGQADAALRTWMNLGTDFNTAANWDTGAPVATDSVYFLTPEVTNPNINTASNLSLGSLNFGFTGVGYTLSSTGGGSLTLTNNGASSSTALQHDSSGTNTISAPLVLGNSTGLTTINVTNGSLVVSGNISGVPGNTGINKNGSGTLTLSGTNSFTGFVLGGGTLTNLGTNGVNLVNINSNTAMGNGNLSFGGTGNFTGFIGNTSGQYCPGSVVGFK